MIKAIIADDEKLFARFGTIIGQNIASMCQPLKTANSPTTFISNEIDLVISDVVMPE